MCRCIDLFIDESDTSILYSIHMFDQYDRRCCFLFYTVPAINEASHHMAVLNSNFSKQN